MRGAHKTSESKNRAVFSDPSIISVSTRRPTISPVLDVPQVFIKAIVDILVYPLLVIGTRLTVYEGPEAISMLLHC